MRCTVSYVAIDFETAYRGAGSASALGIVTWEKGKVTDQWYTLIKPHSMRFELDCVRVNDIWPDRVEKENPFPFYWAEVAKRLEGQYVFAHNAGFDTGVLGDSLRIYDLPSIHFRYGDTVEISRKLWKNLENHKLNTVAAYLSYDFHHHEALEDAKACGAIVAAAMKETGTATVEEMMAALGFSFRTFSMGRERPLHV